MLQLTLVVLAAFVIVLLSVSMPLLECWLSYGIRSQFLLSVMVYLIFFLICSYEVWCCEKSNMWNNLMDGFSSAGVHCHGWLQHWLQVLTYDLGDTSGTVW